MPSVPVPIVPVIDHVVLDMRDGMDAGQALYAGLGFTLTPRGHHTLGSINHLAMFQRDYLELLGWDAAKPARPELHGHPAGLNGLVFKTADADATYAALAAAGVPVQAPQSFSRPVMLDGVRHEARFRTTHLAPGAAGFGRLYFCQHETPELVWRPEWQAHANGAQRIAGLVLAAHDPEASAGLFRRLFGGEAVAGTAEGYRLTAGTADIAIVPVSRAEAGVDPAGRRDFFTTLRLATSATPRRVEAEKAGNVVLVFEAG